MLSIQKLCVRISPTEEHQFVVLFINLFFITVVMQTLSFSCGPNYRLEAVTFRGLKCTVYISCKLSLKSFIFSCLISHQPQLNTITGQLHSATLVWVIIMNNTTIIAFSRHSQLRSVQLNIFPQHFCVYNVQPQARNAGFFVLFLFCRSE